MKILHTNIEPLGCDKNYYLFKFSSVLLQSSEVRLIKYEQQNHCPPSRNQMT
jgi:hypothetical protein